MGLLEVRCIRRSTAGDERLPLQHPLERRSSPRRHGSPVRVAWCRCSIPRRARASVRDRAQTNRPCSFVRLLIAVARIRLSGDKIRWTRKDWRGSARGNTPRIGSFCDSRTNPWVGLRGSVLDDRPGAATLRDVRDRQRRPGQDDDGVRGNGPVARRGHGEDGFATPAELPPSGPEHDAKSSRHRRDRQRRSANTSPLCRARSRRCHARDGRRATRLTTGGNAAARLPRVGARLVIRRVANTWSSTFAIHLLRDFARSSRPRERTRMCRGSAALNDDGVATPR